MFNFSIFFTISRIICVPFLVYFILTNQWSIACLIFLLAALTDTLDGTIARALGQETEFGAYLDPIADKILLVSTYVALLFVNTNCFKIPRWFTLAIFLKELILISGAYYLGLYKHVITIKPTLLGKATTFIQVIFIVFIMFGAYYKCIDQNILNKFFYIIILLNLAVLLQYGYIGYKGIIYE